MQKESDAHTGDFEADRQTINMDRFAENVMLRLLQRFLPQTSDRHDC